MMEINWSWFFPTLTRYAVFENVPVCSGIYMLYEEVSDGSRKCIYVSETENLALSLLNHLLDGSERNEYIKDSISHYVCGFRFARVPDKKTRKEMVKYLVQTWEPKANKLWFGIAGDDDKI